MTTMPPDPIGDRVSVVIPHYGDDAPTRRLVAQLLSQASAPLEVVVVDDASPDPLEPVPGARVIRRERNGGFGTCVNTGVRSARGELVLILNSDLDLEGDTVERLVRATDAWQPCVASPQVLDEVGAFVQTGKRFPRARHHVIEWLVPLARWRAAPLVQRAIGFDLSANGPGVHPCDWVIGAAMLVPRAAFETCGGFDERFFMNCEEVDLQRRLAGDGLPRVVVGDVTVRHVGGGSSDPDRRLGWLVESRLRYADKWGGAGRLRVGLLGATAVNLAWNGVRRLSGRDVDALSEARRQLRAIRGAS